MAYVLLTKGMIADRVTKLARDLMEDFKGEKVHLLCVLKVFIMFASKSHENRELTLSLPNSATSSPLWDIPSPTTL